MSKLAYSKVITLGQNCFAPMLARELEKHGLERVKGPFDGMLGMTYSDYKDVMDGTFSFSDTKVTCRALDRKNWVEEFPLLNDHIMVPHFHPEQGSLYNFLVERNERVERLRSLVFPTKCSSKSGAKERCLIILTTDGHLRPDDVYSLVQSCLAGGDVALIDTTDNVNGRALPQDFEYPVIRTVSFSTICDRPGQPSWDDMAAYITEKYLLNFKEALRA